MSEVDRLTGKWNRVELFERLSVEMKLASAGQTDLALLFIDIDNFKHFNLHNGHSVGDKVLVKFAEMIQSRLSSHQMLFRFGGDEFVVLMPNANRIDTHAVAELIRKDASDQLTPPQLPDCGYPHCLGPAKLSASIGISMWKPGMSTRDFLIDAEDRMLSARIAGGECIA